MILRTMDVHQVLFHDVNAQTSSAGLMGTAAITKYVSYWNVVAVSGNKKVLVWAGWGE